MTHLIKTLAVVAALCASPAVADDEAMTADETMRSNEAKTVCKDLTGRPDHTKVLCAIRDLETRQLKKLKQIAASLENDDRGVPFYVVDDNLFNVTCGPNDCDASIAATQCKNRGFMEALHWTTNLEGDGYHFKSLLCKM